MKSLRNYIEALKLVFGVTKWLTVANLFLTLIQGILPLAIIFLIKELVDAVTLSVNKPDKAEAFSDIIWILIITGIVFLVNALANTIGQYVREYQTQKFTDAMTHKLHQKAVSLDLAFFENSQYHDMFYRALQDAPMRPVNIVNNLFYLTQNLLSIGILSVLLISLHWSVIFVLIAATVPLGFIRMKYASKLYKWQKDNTQNERKSYYFSRILTSDVFAKELRLFRLQNIFSELFQKARTILRESKLEIIIQKTWFESFLHLISAAAIFSAFGFIAREAIFGNLTIGVLVMYFMALQKGMSFFRDFLTGVSSLYEDSLYIENLLSFFNLKNAMSCDNKPNHFPEKLNKGIVFKNVNFKYPNSKRNALENINLNIKSGSTVAIVGDNGAGKTTLVKLLCHLYEADEGDIYFDDVSVKSISDNEIKKNISVLFQDFVLYHLTAKENIWLGDVDKSFSVKSVKDAAAKAGIDTLIENLPKSYDTVLGKLFDDSEELSIGEWQKIALARALFKDSPVIILDEPSSALDPKSEYEIFMKFKEITKDKTSIIVSHRFSTVKMADYIYVMENEKIVEEGTHESLIQLNGKYATMFRMQAEAYV
ncbi:MAG: ABC transporter ATP-binding protein [Bacteroidales bacterium]|nr:ABC transporter ATP-binding protein [Bacteroidales bacterium]